MFALQFCIVQLICQSHLEGAPCGHVVAMMVAILRLMRPTVGAWPQGGGAWRKVFASCSDILHVSGSTVSFVDFCVVCVIWKTESYYAPKQHFALRLNTAYF